MNVRLYDTDEMKECEYVLRRVRQGKDRGE